MTTTIILVVLAMLSMIVSGVFATWGVMKGSILLTTVALVFSGIALAAVFLAIITLGL